MELVGVRSASPRPRVLVTSAIDPAQVREVWRVAETFAATQRASGALLRRRETQARAWLWERIDAGLRERFRGDAAVQRLLPELLDAVDAGRVPVSVAARRLLRAFAGDGGAKMQDDGS